MDGQRFDHLTMRLIPRLTRRRAVTAIAGGALGVLGAATGEGAAAGKRCRKHQDECKRSAQCCGKRSTCGHSHGGGSVTKTCCGKVGAPCPGNALGCCIPLICGPDNRCVEP